jgi:hypothetical protein
MGFTSPRRIHLVKLVEPNTIARIVFAKICCKISVSFPQKELSLPGFDASGNAVTGVA